jgi:glutathione S-transferase
MKLYAMHGAGSIIAEIMMEDMGLGCDIVYPDDAYRQSPAFRGISPYGRIPVLVTDNGTPVFESLAIVLMLLEHDTDHRLAPARDAADYAHFLSWLSYLATTLYPAVLRFHYPDRYGDVDTVRTAALAEMRLVYDHIEALPDDFLVGAKMTVADDYLYMLLTWDEHLAESLSGRPKLQAIHDNVAARPSVAKVMARQDD